MSLNEEKKLFFISFFLRFPQAIIFHLNVYGTLWVVKRERKVFSVFFSFVVSSRCISVTISLYFFVYSILFFLVFCLFFSLKGSRFFCQTFFITAFCIHASLSKSQFSRKREREGERERERERERETEGEWRTKKRASDDNLK